MRRLLLVLIALLTFSSLSSYAQFKEEAFRQSYNDDDLNGAPADTTDRIFNFKEYFGGLAHTRPCKINTSFMGSTVVLGGMQIYNRDYWKLPLIYGGIGSTLGFGLHYKNLYGKTGDKVYQTASTALLAGAGALYWGTLMDGVACFEGEYPLPGKATFYSLLLPGLGQIYNREYWKLAIYWGGFVGSFHFYFNNKNNYERFRRIYIEATTNPEYDVPISAETALYYRDVYRRYRDYSVLAIALVYVLQIIDANVFAYMHNFEVDDNITLNVTPTLIAPDFQYASNGGAGLGMSFGLTF